MNHQLQFNHLIQIFIALIRIFLHKLCECLSFDVVSGNGPAAVFFDRDCLNGRNVDAANGLNSCADQSFV